MPQILKHPLALILLGVIVGTAYGTKIPVVGTVAKKLPGASQ
jgi:hypothetical protein